MAILAYKIIKTAPESLSFFVNEEYNTIIGNDKKAFCLASGAPKRARNSGERVPGKEAREGRRKSGPFVLRQNRRPPGDTWEFQLPGAVWRCIMVVEKMRLSSEAYQ